VTQLVRTFHAYNEIPKFVTVYSRDHHWPYPEPDESNPQLLTLFP